MTEPKVMLVQYLCPARHCIAAAIYLPSETRTFETTCQDLKDGMAKSNVNPWCGVCGSKELKFEQGPTPFKSLEEAEAPILQSLLDQLATRALLDKAGLTYDSKLQQKN
jgi:hypothetical protein